MENTNIALKLGVYLCVHKYVQILLLYICFQGDSGGPMTCYSGSTHKSRGHLKELEKRYVVEYLFIDIHVYIVLHFILIVLRQKHRY
jgi:hypothetical protein